MTENVSANSKIKYASNFEELITIPFYADVNAACWKRSLHGDFAEIISLIERNGEITEVDMETLQALQLSEAGKLAREIIVQDFADLTKQGASPVLNVIECYEEDDSYPFFPTDVYSFHVDRSPIPTDTFLCTYYGASSDILANEDAEQKILVREIREELRTLYDGNESGFDTFLSEHFFDLHYRIKANASPISLGVGNLWRLAVDCPESPSLPCIHRAPKEKEGEPRLLMIC